MAEGGEVEERVRWEKNERKREWDEAAEGWEKNERNREWDEAAEGFCVLKLWAALII